MELPEIFDLLQRQVIPRQMQPTVEEHAPVSSGQDESVTVDPTRVLGKVTKRMSKEDRSDLSATKRQAEVTGSCRLNSVHGQAAGLSSGLRENFCV
jgi:hypothetical protein